MASLTHPYGTFSDYGTGWAGRYTATKTRLDAEDVGLLCRAAVAVGPGRASLLAGVRHEAADGQLKRAVNTGVGDVLTGVTAKSRGVGYSVGLAYEIPEAAFRAQIVYYSQIDHRLEGAATIENINAPAAVFRVLQATRLTDVTADLPTPGSVVGHARLGIAPDWQIAGTIRWVNWSVLRSFAIRSANGTADFDTPLHLQNSATYSLGVGHAVTPSLSVRGFAFLDEDSAQDATRSPISPGGQSVGLGFGASYRFEAGPTVTGTVVGSRSDTVSVTQTSTSFGQTSDIRIRYDATYTAGLELGVTFPF
jgi:long-chain fatty acid transport protein